MQVIFDPAGSVLRGVTAAEDISVSTRATTVYDGKPVIAYDARYSEGNGVGAVVTTLDVTPGALGWSGRILSLSPDVCSVSGNTVTSLANGLGSVLIDSPGGGRTQAVLCQTDIGLSPNPLEFAPGSLNRYVRDMMAAYTAGKTFSDDTTRVYDGLALNPKRIAQDVDVSWIEFYHGNGDIQGPCSLVSPRHALCATHFNVSAQWGVWSEAHQDVTSTFRRQDGTLQTVRVIGKADLGDDLTVLYFDAPITGCDFAKLARTSDIIRKCPYLASRPDGRRYSIPVFLATKNPHPARNLIAGRRFSIHRIGGINFGVGLSGTTDYERALPEYIWEIGYYQNDSGSPIFFPLVEPGSTKTTVVLLSSLYAVGGPAYGSNIPLINATMNTLAANAGDPLAGAYAVQVADLSAFTNYT